jgi:hypothetical protein
VKSLKNSPSGAESGFSLIHYTRDGVRETGGYDGMPVIGQENPRPKHKVMFLSALAHHAGQALEFGVLDHPPVRQEPARNEDESVE